MCPKGIFHFFELIHKTIPINKHTSVILFFIEQGFCELLHNKILN